MAARRKARKRALDILFAAEARRMPAPELLVEVQQRGDPVVQPYAETLVQGVWTHREEIDGVIQRQSPDWALARMPAVDRGLLRIATYEILHEADVPGPVAVSEAVELARDLSTDDSPSFVNGVLAGVLRRVESRVVPDTEEGDGAA